MIANEENSSVAGIGIDELVRRGMIAHLKKVGGRGWWPGVTSEALGWGCGVWGVGCGVWGED
jgi:hypothetical protein